MRQADVQIGDTYRTKVGGRMATAKVMRAVGKRGGSREQFHCITIDTHKDIYRTAARLRPLVEPPKAAPAKREVGDFPSHMVAHLFASMKPLPCACAQPNEVATRIRSADILRLDEAHSNLVRFNVDRIHVAEPFRTVAAAIRRMVAKQYRYMTVPRALRRGLLFAAAQRHAHNRTTYRMVMGQHPFPSEEMIGRAVLGTDADRERLLRHVDALRNG